mgnify:CR=1 FL=1
MRKMYDVLDMETEWLSVSYPDCYDVNNHLDRIEIAWKKIDGTTIEVKGGISKVEVSTLNPEGVRVVHKIFIPEKSDFQQVCEYLKEVLREDSFDHSLISSFSDR